MSPSVITVESGIPWQMTLVEGRTTSGILVAQLLMGRRRCRPGIRSDPVGSSVAPGATALPAFGQRTCGDPACHAHLPDDLRCLHPRLVAPAAGLPTYSGRAIQLGTGRVGDSMGERGND